MEKLAESHKHGGDIQSKLNRSLDNLEKLRKDHKIKTDKVNWLEGQVSFLEDKLRNVESRGEWSDIAK